MKMDEDDSLLADAINEVAHIMHRQDIDFATALIVALRDYINDYYEDDTMGYQIVAEVAKGRESFLS
jgi:hypothetical protein